MASERPKRILLSKTDLTEKEIAALSDAEAWSIIYALQPKNAKDERAQICFTGFGATQRATLEKEAAEHGLRVMTSVTKNLKYLVAGKNAGPKKIEKARANGVSVLNEDEFRSFLLGKG